MMVVEWLQTPYFGIVISIVFYELGLIIQRKTRFSFFHPLLISVAMIIGILLFFDIDIEYYNRGGNIIESALGPATVALAVPLYNKLELLKSNLIPILGGVTAGCITAITSGWYLARLFGLSEVIGLSIIPKSVTTPIAMEISEHIGGIYSLTVAIVVMTGILGAVIGPAVLKIFNIEDEIARGLAMGTASHAIGTAKALELGETEGAMSSLAIGLAGLITVLLVPAFVLLI